MPKYKCRASTSGWAEGPREEFLRGQQVGEIIVEANGFGLAANELLKQMLSGQCDAGVLLRRVGIDIVEIPEGRPNFQRAFMGRIAEVSRWRHAPVWVRGPTWPGGPISVGHAGITMKFDKDGNPYKPPGG